MYITRVLLTRARAGTSSLREARALLAAHTVPTFHTAIHLREAYSHTYGLVPTDLREYQAVLEELVAAPVLAEACHG